MGQGRDWGGCVIVVSLCILLSGVHVHGFDDMSEDAEVFPQDPAMQTEQEKYTPLETIEGYSIPTDMMPSAYQNDLATKRNIPRSFTKPSNLRARTATKQIAALSAREKAVEAEAASIHHTVTKLKRQQLAAEMDELKGDPALRQLFKNQEQIQGEIQELVEIIKGKGDSLAGSNNPPPLGDKSTTQDEVSQKGTSQKIETEKKVTKASEKNVDAGEIIQRGVAEVMKQKSAAETDLERFAGKDQVVEAKTGAKEEDTMADTQDKDQAPAQGAKSNMSSNTPTQPISSNPYNYMMMVAMYNQMMMNQYAASKAMMDQQRLHASVQPSHYQSIGGSPMQPVAGEEYMVGGGLPVGLGEYSEEGLGEPSYNSDGVPPQVAYPTSRDVEGMLPDMGEFITSNESEGVPGSMDSVGLNDMEAPDDGNEPFRGEMTRDGESAPRRQDGQGDEAVTQDISSVGSASAQKEEPKVPRDPVDELTLAHVQGLEHAVDTGRKYESKTGNGETTKRLPHQEPKVDSKQSEGNPVTKGHDVKAGENQSSPKTEQSVPVPSTTNTSPPKTSPAVPETDTVTSTPTVAGVGAPGGGLPPPLSTGQAIVASQETGTQVSSGEVAPVESSQRFGGSDGKQPTILAPPPGAIAQATVYTPADQVLPKPKAASLVARADNLDVPVGGDALTLGEMQHWSQGPEMYEPAAPLTAPSTDIPDNMPTQTQGIKLTSATRRKLLRSLRMKKMRMLKLRRRLMSDMRLKMMRKLSEKK